MAMQQLHFSFFGKIRSESRLEKNDLKFICSLTNFLKALFVYFDYNLKLGRCCKFDNTDSIFIYLKQINAS